ncbi:MAG: hypothetical protein JNK11_17380 [Alphaproteobacteria bacterium]|nr:hypothetical protein [Alphaproteobacteria bacterium]
MTRIDDSSSAPSGAAARLPPGGPSGGGRLADPVRGSADPGHLALESIAALRSELIRQRGMRRLLDLGPDGDTAAGRAPMVARLGCAAPDATALALAGSATVLLDAPNAAGGHLTAPADERVLRFIAQQSERALSVAGLPRLFLSLGTIDRPVAPTENGSAPLDPGGRAPVYLLPVSLTRGAEGWFLQALGDVTENPLLSDVAAQTVGATLPPPMIEEPPEAYLARVRAAVSAAAAPWLVTSQANLALLPVGTYRLYRELDPRLSPHLAQSPPVRAAHAPVRRDAADWLIDRSSRSPAADGGTDWAKDWNLDSRPTDRVPAPLHDADADMVGAMADARESPPLLAVAVAPGLARARAAASLAADALARGQSVLYVTAQRALRRRFRRTLDEHGMGAASISLAPDAPGPLRLSALQQADAALREGSSDLASAETLPPQVAVEEPKRRLARYARLISAAFGASGMTPHDIVWAAEQRRLDLLALLGDETRRIPELPTLPDVARWSAERIADLRARVDGWRGSLIAYMAIHPEIQRHVWRGFQPDERLLPEHDVGGERRSALEAALARMESSAIGIGQALARFTEETGVALPATVDGAAVLAALRDAIPAPPADAALELLPGLADEAGTALLQRVEERLRLLRAGNAQMRRAFGPQWEEIDATAVRTALRLAEATLSLVADDTKAIDLGAEAQDLRRRAADIKGGLDSFEDSCRSLSLPLPATPTTARAIAAAVASGAEAPLDALALRSDILMAPEAGRSLADARLQADRLLEGKARLGRIFKLDDLDALPTGEDLTEASYHLGNAGVAAALRSGYREARRIFQSLAIPEIAGRVSDPERQARFLAELADWRFDCDSFAANRAFKQALGPAFAGIQTPFDQIERLIRWMRRTNALLADLRAPEGAGDDEIAVAATLRERLRKLLIGAKPEMLRRLAELAADGAAERIRALFGESEPKARVRHLLHASNTLLECSEALSQVGIMADVSVRDALAAAAGFDTLLHARRALAADADAERILGARFKGLDTDVGPLVAARDWVRALRADPVVPRGLSDWLAVPEAQKRLSLITLVLYEAAHHGAQLRLAREEVSDFGKLDWAAWCDLDAGSLAVERRTSDLQKADSRNDALGGGLLIAAVAQRAGKARAAIASLPAWADYCVRRHDLASSGLGDIVTLVESRQLAPQQAVAFYEYAVATAMARSVMRIWPELDEFSRIDLLALADDFAALDGKAAIASARAVAAAVAGRAKPSRAAAMAASAAAAVGPESSAATGLAALGRELAAQAERDVGANLRPGAASEDENRGDADRLASQPRLSLRGLFRRATAEMLALFPCVVADDEGMVEHLDPGRAGFDLVIVDTATGLSTAVAYAALGRGRRGIVLGSEREAAFAAFSAGPRPARRLRWDSEATAPGLLVARTFGMPPVVAVPPRIDPATPPLVVRRVPRGRGASDPVLGIANPIEADAVATAAIDHLAARTAQESLAVLAADLAQRDLLRERIATGLAARADAAAGAKALAAAGAPLIVETIDRLEGEQRERVLLSVALAPDDSGQKMAAGTLAGPAAAGLLLSAARAARSQLELFTALDPDGRDAAGAAAGERPLRAVLAAAQGASHWHRREQLAGRSAPTPFAIAVAAALARHGIPTIAPYDPYGLGAGGMLEIVVGARGPASSGRFVPILAIESDAPKPPGERSTRDRDRLRVDALRGAGWRVFRLRTLSWLLDRQGSEARLLTAIAEAEATL